MTLETLALVGVAGFFIWKLYRSIQKTPRIPMDKIRLVSKETGEVLEMQIVQPKNLKAKQGWDESEFIASAKLVFQKILSAFALCNLKELKKSLAPEVYEAFERDILSRQTNKQKMEFSLICFDSAKVIKKTQNNDEITICFKTEQINLLKDEKGSVIEGDPMNISIMDDTWTFKKIGKESWIITDTQSRAATCAD